MKQMIKYKKIKSIGTWSAICMLLTMVCIPAALAQQSTTTHAATTTTSSHAPNPVSEEENETKSPNSADGQGIKIHGHWVLDVKNADGTIVEHRDFQNSLITSAPGYIYFGSATIAGLLSGTLTMGGFGVGLVTGPASTAGYDPSTFCAGFAANNNTPGGYPPGIQCYGINSASNSVVSFYNSVNATQHNLVASFVASPTLGTPMSIVLTSNYVVPTGMGPITAVQTYTGMCDVAVFGAGASTPFNSETIAPSACTSTAPGSNTYGPFTSTTIPALTVTAGQTLAVSVTFTFS